MPRIGKIALLCLAAAAVVSLGMVSGADAKKTAKRARIGSEVTLQSVGPDRVAGRVSAGEKTCRAQRQIYVYRVDSPGSVPNSEFVASTFTRGDGSWDVPGPMYPSEFFAVAGPKKAKHSVCASATSNHLVWG